MAEANVEASGELLRDTLHTQRRDARGAPDEGFQHHVEEAP